MICCGRCISGSDGQFARRSWLTVLLSRPGARVFYTMDGSRHLMTVVRTQDDVVTFSVTLKYWDLSLNRPVEQEWIESIFYFTGSRRIDELEAIPYDLLPNAENVFTELVKRGQKARDIPHGSLQWFEGFVNVPIPYSNDTRRKWIAGRVIVDPKEYDKTVVAADPNMFGIQPPAPMPRRQGAAIPTDEKVEVTTEQLAQSSAVVRGFSFATKSCMQCDPMLGNPPLTYVSSGHKFNVDGVEAVEWNDHVSQ